MESHPSIALESSCAGPQALGIEAKSAQQPVGCRPCFARIQGWRRVRFGKSADLMPELSSPGDGAVKKVARRLLTRRTVFLLFTFPAVCRMLPPKHSSIPWNLDVLPARSVATLTLRCE